jgi:hypothetical protein
MVKLFPVASINLLEEGVLFLASLWLWKLLSLRKIERQSEHLLQVRWIVHLSIFPVQDSVLIVGHALMKLGNMLVKGTSRKWLWLIIFPVDQLLKSNRISTALLKLLHRAESNILKSMNFTKLPEEIIFILTSSLNLKLLGKVWVDLFSFSNFVEQACLSKWTTVVNVKILPNLTLRISR